MSKYTHVLYECEICSCYHPWSWNGDCRDDKNRYAFIEDFAKKHGISEDNIEVRSMQDRVDHDMAGL